MYNPHLPPLFVWLSETEFQLRKFSAEGRNTDVSYAQLKQLLADGKTVVVDVREPWELREYGFIPGSVNVPREWVEKANWIYIIWYSWFKIWKYFKWMFLKKQLASQMCYIYLTARSFSLDLFALPSLPSGTGEHCPPACSGGV